MKRGQSLKIYLMDGDATGKWSCVLSGKTTKAFKVPRTHYKSCVDIAELRGTAVYLLFGEDVDTDRPVVYVGETEDAYKRLDEHNKSEERRTNKKNGKRNTDVVLFPFSIIVSLP